MRSPLRSPHPVFDQSQSYHNHQKKNPAIGGAQLWAADSSCWSCVGHAGHPPWLQGSRPPPPSTNPCRPWRAAALIQRQHTPLYMQYDTDAQSCTIRNPYEICVSDESQTGGERLRQLKPILYYMASIYRINCFDEKLNRFVHLLLLFSFLLILFIYVYV